jgi:hypothetical protein
MSKDNYTLEELLEAIGKKPEKKQASFKSNVDSKIKDFVEKYEIETGVNRMPNYHIYYEYKKLFGGNLSRIEFFRQFNKHGFIQARTGKQKYYLLNGEFDLSREGKLKAEFYEQEEKNKKGQGKISRPKRKNKSET